MAQEGWPAVLRQCAMTNGRPGTAPGVPGGYEALDDARPHTANVPLLLTARTTLRKFHESAGHAGPRRRARTGMQVWEQSFVDESLKRFSMNLCNPAPADQ